MSMIQVSHLTFHYEDGSENIFEDVSFELDTSWKLGLTGRNGKGKTTLFKILSGKQKGKGTVISPVDYLYFPFQIQDATQLTLFVIEDLLGEVASWQLERELNLLEVDSEVLYRPFDTLSQGEQTKVLLASLFIRDDTFVLIDEPTNHLDLKGRELVSAYLKKKKGFILVSHDRAFLDGCIDHIMSLNKTSIDIQKGNYSSWEDNMSRRMQDEKSQQQRLKTEIKKMEKAKRQTADWSDQVEKSKIGAADKGHVGHMAAKMMKRSKSLEKRQQKHIDEKKTLLRDLEEQEDLKIHLLPLRRSYVLRMTGVTAGYEAPLFEPLSFEIQPHDRIALVGGNGCGKSTLLHLLTRDQTHLLSGKIEIPSDLVISSIAQDPSFLKGPMTAYAEGEGLDISLFLAILAKLGLTKEHFERPMESMSPGQQKKILIAASLAKPAHLYIYDEPLNYLDIISRAQLEKVILTYQPTMLFVEHDAVFLEKVATRRIEMHPFG